MLLAAAAVLAVLYAFIAKAPEVLIQAFLLACWLAMLVPTAWALLRWVGGSLLRLAGL